MKETTHKKHPTTHKATKHKAVHSVKHSPHHKKVKNDFKFNALYGLMGVIALVVIIVVIMNMLKPEETPIIPSDVAAVVNGEEILISDIDEQYAVLPDTYKAQVTKEILLTQNIEKVLLVQEAKRQGITVSEERVELFVDQIVTQSGFSEEALLVQLEQRGLTMDDIYDMYRDQLIVVELVNQTILPSIEVTEEEIQAFYTSNQENLASLEDSRDQIVQLVKFGKQAEAVQEYVDDLKGKSTIEVLENFAGSTAPITPSTPSVPAGSISTFTATGDELCMEDGKPVIYLFSTTWCPHCKWITETFEKTVKSYGDKIVAYHYELDINDDTLTPEVEGTIPPEHKAIYNKYNPKGSIPTFVFGCQYSRVGNGHESQDDLAAEEAEFRAVIDAVLS